MKIKAIKCVIQQQSQLHQLLLFIVSPIHRQ
jgi:hypothetical protein